MQALRRGLGIVARFFKPDPPTPPPVAEVAEIELDQLVGLKTSLTDAELTKSKLETPSMEEDPEIVEKNKRVIEKAIQKTGHKINKLKGKIKTNVVNAQARNVTGTESEKEIAEIKQKKQAKQAKLTSLIDSIPEEHTCDIDAAKALAKNADTCDKLSIALDSVPAEDGTPTVRVDIVNVDALKGDAALHFNSALDTEAAKLEQNDKINKLQVECLPDVVFEYNDKTKNRLRELREVLVQEGVTVFAFQNTCISQAGEQLATVMQNYPCFADERVRPARELMAKITAKRLTSSWTRYLNCPNNANDESVDATNDTFFNRVNAGIEGLRACSIYSSREWRAYKESETLIGARVPAGAPPPPPDPPGSVPLFNPPHPVPPELYYDTVTIGPYRYVIGPILDFNNIEGRIFIYVKCYDDDTYTTGTYFWVYRSQSEGLFRVFFKLIANSSIEKGYDYTQASLVVFKLQVAFCNYYERHSRRGRKNPIVLNTLGRLNYFMKNMSYLQRPNFLDTFPGATIQPSHYSIPSARNPVWGVNAPPYCANPPPAPTPNNECCYVCLTRTFLPAPLPLGLTQSPRMIGHYYTIDPIFEPIIHKGFPTDQYGGGMVNIRRMPDYHDEYATLFDRALPDDHPYRRFARDDYYDTTFPYIFCFTTCCIVSGGSSFDLFLDTDNYKRTFWCQGFDDFTTKMTPAPALVAGVAGAAAAVNPVLSPVLYVILGAFLSDPDFALSAFRHDILNVAPIKSYFSSAPIIDEYRKSTKILMTLGTKEEDRSIYQPAIDPYPRRSATAAFKSLRDKSEEVNTEYKRRILLSQTDNVIKQRLLVRDKVQKKLDMLKVIAAAAYRSSVEDRRNFVIQLLRTKAGFNIGDVDALDLEAKVEQLRNKTLELTRILENVRPGFALPFKEKIRILSGEDRTINEADNEIFLKAIAFIRASPTAAATAVFGFYSSQIIQGVDGVNVTKFEDDLTDYALLCLKKNWLFGMMDDAYGARTTLFDPDSIKLYYLDQNGDFVYMGDGNHTCYNPSVWPPVAPLVGPPPPPGHVGPWNPLPPYIFKSSFDEIRSVDANDKTTPEVAVTICTLANMYQVDCYYDKPPPTNTRCSMSTTFQVSSTIVYTRDANPIIPYAMDMQKIPLSCIPDLPEVLERAPAAGGGGGAPVAPISQHAGAPVRKTREPAERKKEQQQQELKREQQQQVEAELRNKEKLLPAQIAHNQHRQRVMDQDETRLIALLAANPTLSELYSMLKSPYTLCGTFKRVSSYGALLAGKMMDYFFRIHKQLPLFFENFPQELQLCHQYCSTALIYDSDVSPYNLLQIPPDYSFLERFAEHFGSIGVSFNRLGCPAVVTDDRTFIQHKLQETTRNMKAISEFLTKDFMMDTDTPDDETVESMSQPSESSAQSLSKASVSTTNSQLSKTFCSFDEGSIRDGSDALCFFLTEAPLEESYCGNDPDVREEDFDDDDDGDGDAPGAGAENEGELPVVVEEGDELPEVAEERDVLDVAPVVEPVVARGSKRRLGGGNKPRLTTVATTKRNRKYKSRSSPKRKSKSNSRHRRNNKITNKTFCRKRKSYLSRKPYAKQTLKKGVKH
jgi:hypothetical protein